MNVRLIESAEIPAANALHNSYYGTCRTDEQMQWCFVSPLLTPIPFAILEQDGCILGTQGFIPVRMIDSEGEFLTGKWEETLVVPAAFERDPGAFGNLNALLFDLARQHSVAVGWGFTRRQKAFRRLGFHVPLHTSQRLFPLSPWALAWRKRRHGSATPNLLAWCKSVALGSALVGATGLSMMALMASRLTLGLRMPRRINLKTLDHAPSEAGELSRRFVRQWGGATIFRDAEYLDWRLFRNPFTRVTFRAAYLDSELVGWIAYAVGSDGLGHIVDVFLAPERADARELEAMLAFLLRDSVFGLAKCGAHGVVLLQASKHPFNLMLDRVAALLGFHSTGKGSPMVAYRFDGDSPRVSLDALDNWYITAIYTQGMSG